MRNWLHRLFGKRETQKETAEYPEECQTETVHEDVHPTGETHSQDSRTFDITACDDVEVEEIDGELH